MNFNEFVLSEKASRDTIDVKRVYVDMADDLVAGILLSQIIYWYLPDKNGKSKLRVRHEGEMWIAKTRDAWWDECRISAKQYDRAIGILEEKNLVATDTTLFAGKPSKVVRLLYDNFMSAYQAVLTPQIMVSEERSLPLGNNDIDERASTITETTTEITTEVPTAEITIKLDPNYAIVTKAYENTIPGTLTKTMADILKEAVDEYPADLIVDALKETAKAHARNWNYTAAILKNWKTNGKGSHNVAASAPLVEAAVGEGYGYNRRLA